MTTLLPTDSDYRQIPVLRLKGGGAHRLNVTATSARLQLASGAQIIRVHVTAPVFVRTGDDTVTATDTDHYLSAGLPYDFSLGDEGQARPIHTHIAAVSASDSDAVLYISEME